MKVDVFNYYHNKNNFLIAYDIFDEKRLPRVRRVVYSFALGGQKSALEAPLNKIFIRELIANLLDETKKEDKINIIKFFGKPILLGKAKHTPYENRGIIII